MSVRKRLLRLSEDFTLERASALLTAEEGGQISPDAKEVYEEILENLGFPRNADQVKVESQSVFEGQLLVLGDSRVGKTSLVKALSGEKFNDKEEMTHGVEAKIVDRKWKTQELTELVFGRFNQFCDEKKQESALMPRIFNKLKYRYGSSHYAQELDRVPLTLERLLIEKSGISTIVGDSPLSHALVFWMLLVILAVLLGRWPSCILLMAAEFSLNIVQAFKGVGIKYNLFKYSGVLFGGLLAKCCLANVFTVPLFSDVIQVSYLPSEGVKRELTLVIVDLCVVIITAFVVVLVYEPCRYVCGRLFSRHCSSIFLLLDNVVDVIDSLETMMLMAFYVCIHLSLFSVAHIKILTAEVVVGIIVMHLLYLYHQKLHRSRVAIAALVLELALGISASLYNTFLGSVSVLVIAFSLHGYGKWLQIRGFFHGKSFIDVAFRAKFAICTFVVQKMLVNKKKLLTALDEAFASLKLRVLDFAGDKEYYVYHHMFLRREALYIIVFSIRDFVQDNFQNTDRKVERLRFWLESVCSHVSPCTPIFLVGTHRGKVKANTLNKLNSHLRHNLWSTFCDQLVTCKYKGRHFIYFPVENSGGLSDRNGICKLQSAITRVAHEKWCKANMCVEVPHSWIKVQDTIIGMRESHSKQLCWKLDEFKEQMRGICSITDNDLRSMLKYFHAKGLVMYVEKDQVLSQWVLLKPELLVEIIIKLVNIMPEERQKRGSRQHWNLLRDTGMLTKPLLHAILSRTAGEEGVDAVRRLLEEYDLICPLSHGGHSSGNTTGVQETHFVPSLLPSISSNKTWCDDPGDVRCYFFFQKFLPEMLFHRLVSWCYKHSILVYPVGERPLYRDCGLFWLGPQKPYHLKLLKEEGLIEVTFNRNSGVDMLPHDVLVHIWGIVKNICENNFPFLEFHCGPACPSEECTGAQSKVFHGTRGSGKRRHVFQVLRWPSAKGRISFCCLNRSFETDFKEWMA